VSEHELPAAPGLVGFRISASESTGLDWERIDESWQQPAKSAPCRLYG